MSSPTGFAISLFIAPAIFKSSLQFIKDLFKCVLGFDVNKCMTKAFVEGTFGRLCKLDVDNCIFYGKICFAKELFNIMSSVEQLALESYFASPRAVVKQKRWATFIFCWFAKLVCASRWIDLSNFGSHVRLAEIFTKSRHLFGGRVVNLISDGQQSTSVKGFRKSRGSKNKAHWNANSGGVL